jgi:hypothetical protein
VTDEATARGVVQTRELARGRPGRRLVKMTKRDRSGLLVVGHRGVSGVHRLVLGSVSESLRLQCAVFCARSAPGQRSRSCSKLDDQHRDGPVGDAGRGAPEKRLARTPASSPDREEAVPVLGRVPYERLSGLPCQ